MTTTIGRRRPLTVLTTAVAAAALAVTMVTPGAQAAGGSTATTAADALALTAPTYTVPKRAGEPAWLTAVRQSAVKYVRNGVPVTLGPDPRIALTPDDTTADRAGWARTAAAASARRAAAKAASPQAAAARLTVVDREPTGSRGFNDTLATAQAIPAFGTSAGRTPAADFSGVLAAGPAPTYVRQPPNVEDDGLPETARDTGVSDVRRGFRTTGTIGDAPAGPNGQAQPDTDAYAMDLTKGQLFEASFRLDATTEPDSEFLLVLVDEDGRTVTDSFFSENIDFKNPSLSAPVPATGRYYLLAIGFTIIFFGDEVKVVQSVGDYTIKLGVREGDTDVYAVTLAGGDVLGFSVDGAARISAITAANGTELMRSQQDASYIFPAETPLPGGGNALADAVAPRAGTYYVTVLGGGGAYTASAEVYRPGGTGKAAQTIFLDYDGARLNTGIWGGRGVTTLSPLSSFLPAWGLTPADRKVLGRRIKETVQENLDTDLRAAGLSSTVAVNVVTSDESPDLWGRANVTRVVVGGTIDESGIGTIGIAQSIDPGNFEREETALVLLDVLSGSPDDYGDASLNAYIRPRSQRLQFVGRAVGNVVAHEAGHMLGNWHTDNENQTPSIMDAGGVFALLYGVGADGVGGTADDIDTDFVTDRYDLFEGFAGRENTTAKTAWGLSR